MNEGELGGGECLDGGIPYLLRRGCCSVVQDCLELPPVPGIFEGKTKACDGPDLLELPFLYVSLHFLLCYTPPSIFATLSGSRLFFLPLCLTYTLRLSTDIPPVSLFPGDILHFTRNILIILCSSASSLCRTTCECPEICCCLKESGCSSLRPCERDGYTKGSNEIWIYRKQTFRKT